eukprot:4522573-Pyramimonas_sp.AAC.1
MPGAIRTAPLGGAGAPRRNSVRQMRHVSHHAEAHHSTCSDVPTPVARRSQPIGHNLQTEHAQAI